MEFSRREYWGGLLFPSAGDLPEPGNTEPTCEGWDFFFFFSVRFFHVFKEILSNTQLTCKLKETSVATKNTGCTKLGHKSY